MTPQPRPVSPGCTAAEERERGAAAVEFALVVPVLLAIVLGIIEFGMIFNAQIQVTAAARDAARVVSITDEPATAMGDAVNVALASAPTVPIAPASVNIAVVPAGTAANPCPAGSEVTVTINHSVDSLTGLFGAATPLTGTGVMRCGV
ncbi:pilus assembly protein [Citricoccus sp. SGAir0253]|uniref:TadE/TadG family type IV pilus assembly protein n=1 Tax=Citricoccus sp. SGAir0253 TaxID=2567881 RepID=UPI0010CD14E0|nr:TadE/TadG family type IV pilus assembly protein [Citricoccus sp. SGAir0253]QCU77506.1 pilus assembly protein [Citricoccus sp. SGAir0253]